MSQQDILKPRPWETVRDHIEGKLKNTLQRWHTYRIQNAIYTLIRYSLGLSRVTDLAEEQLDAAVAIADTCLEIVSLDDSRL